MVTIIVDGKEFSANTSQVRTMGELVELVKANIDPEMIITSMTINGEQLGESDWRAPISAQGNSNLAITTGTKEQFIEERIKNASAIVDHIINEFAHARACLGNGLVADGNSALSTAVTDLQAFINWYNQLLSLSANNRMDKGSFDGHIQKVVKTCEQIVQQQLYQSWWAIAETLEKQLEPQLEEIKALLQ